MRRGALGLGIVLALALAGCGGGGSSPSNAAILQAQSKMRAMIKSSVDSRLEKLGRPAEEIACVDRNIEAMTSEQIAERVVEAAPAEPPAKESAAQVEAPFGKGCP
jgi:hypothetical protein